MRPLTPDSKFLTTPPLDQVGQAITPLRTQNTNTSLVFTLSPAIELFNWTNHLVTLRFSPAGHTQLEAWVQSQMSEIILYGDDDW